MPTIFSRPTMRCPFSWCLSVQEHGMGGLLECGRRHVCLSILAKDSKDDLAHAWLRASGALATESKTLEAPQVQFVETAKPRKSPKLCAFHPHTCDIEVFCSRFVFGVLFSPILNVLDSMWREQDPHGPRSPPRSPSFCLSGLWVVGWVEGTPREFVGIVLGQWDVDPLNVSCMRWRQWCWIVVISSMNPGKARRVLSWLCLAGFTASSFAKGVLSSGGSWMVIVIPSTCTASNMMDGCERSWNRACDKIG